MQPDVPTSTVCRDSDARRPPGLRALRLGRKGTTLVAGFWAIIAATLVARVAMYDQIAVGQVKEHLARLAVLLTQALGIG